MNEFAEITTSNIRYNLIHLKHLIFEVTDACNLRCKYCAYADLYEGYDERENLTFPFERAKLLINYLYEFWKEFVPKNAYYPIAISFYGGEPTLNVSFIRKVISYLESLPPIGRKFIYSMTTNALLLDKYMDFLVEKDFNLLISLDGDEQGQSYRVDSQGHNSFKRVFRNIKMLEDKYPDFFKNNVSFNSVIHNKNTASSAHQFIKTNFGKETKLSSLSPLGMRKDKQEEFYKTFRSVFSSLKETDNCEQLEQELFINNPQTYWVMNVIRKFSGNIVDNYTQLFVDQNKISGFPTATCLPFSKKMFVTVKGRILQCEKINHEFSFGTVDDEKVNLDLEHIVEQYNNYVFKYINQCKKCALGHRCSLCIYEVDTIHEPDTKCKSFVTQKELEKRISKQMEYLGKHPELYRRILNEVIIK